MIFENVLQCAAYYPAIPNLNEMWEMCSGKRTKIYPKWNKALVLSCFLASQWYTSLKNAARFGIAAYYHSTRGRKTIRIYKPA